MCCPRRGAEFRQEFSELAELPGQANSSARKTIFGDAAVLRQAAAIAAMEMPRRAKLSPRIRSGRRGAGLGCWWARESSGYLRLDPARGRPRIVHEEWLGCGVQDFRLRLAGWAIRPAFCDLAARPAKVSSLAGETIFCVGRALPRENAPVKLARLASRRNRR